MVMLLKNSGLESFLFNFTIPEVCVQLRKKKNQNLICIGDELFTVLPFPCGKMQTLHGPVWSRLS